MTHYTRRGALALLGSVALAGCGSDLLSSEPPTLDAAALRDAVAGDAPAYPERVPVSIAPAHLDAARTRAQRLLGSVPPRFEPSHVPNGAIRERMQHAREHAETSLAGGSEAETRFERLDALASARADARFIAAAWRAVDDGLTREGLADEAETVRSDLRDLRERWSYVGGDPVEATVVHAAIERRVDAGGLSVADGHGRYRAGNPLGVGEAAEEVERGRTDHEDAAHVYDRWRGALDDPTDLEPTLTAVEERLRATLRSDLPSGAEVDPDRPWSGLGRGVEGTMAERVLEELYRPLDPRHADVTEPPEAGRLAQSILWKHGTVAHLLAFRRTRDRVADGERFAVSSTDDVAALRADAVDALRAADEAPAPASTHRLLSSLADRLRYADERVAEYDGSVRVERVEHDVSPYVVVAALARATPAASERVATAFRRA